MPPVFGRALATSASESAPHIASIPPTTHTASMAPGPGNLFAMPAGDRKIPDPMVIPTTIETALHSPRRLGSPLDGSSLPAGEGDMSLWYSRKPCGASHALCWSRQRLLD